MKKLSAVVLLALAANSALAASTPTATPAPTTPAQETSDGKKVEQPAEENKNDKKNN